MYDASGLYGVLFVRVRSSMAQRFPLLFLVWSLPSRHPMGGSDADDGEVWRTFIPPTAILTILNASATVRIRCDSTIFSVAAKISVARTLPQRFILFGYT